jgi:hydrogenase expression/formation protein HypD
MTGEKDYLAALLEEVRGETAPVSLMEVCGTHTVAIARSGLRELVPSNLRLLSGPGCPVCVTAQGDIDAVLELARQPQVTLATFGDMMRVPGSTTSLQEERSRGADVRIVYSPLDALEMARALPDRQVVFLGIGFETTAPTVAVAILQAAAQGITNFSVWSLHKVVPPALEALFADPDVRVDGLICPGHVSAVIGAEPYQAVVSRYGKACVITGFETRDLLEGIVMLLRQLRRGRPQVEIQYRRVVRPQGNPVARGVLQQVFTTVPARWRGLGTIPDSGLAVSAAFQAWDARVRFPLPEREDQPIPGCSCGEVLCGKITPRQCRLFGRGCTPLRPVGPCMVSQEGACAAYYRFSPGKETDGDGH